MKIFFDKYLNDEFRFEKYQIIGIILLIISFSGVFGWLYEFIFYRINDGRFSFQGGNFLPWVNIYAIGSILILLSTYKIKKKPVLVFIVSGIVTGILEYFSGLAIYKICNGLRLWDYNTEIWNFGNIGGFICFRSILVFSLCGLFLMYVIVPLFIKLSFKLKKRTFLIISISICSMFIIDELYNLVIARLFNLTSANDFYSSLGWKYPIK